MRYRPTGETAMENVIERGFNGAAGAGRGKHFIRNRATYYCRPAGG
ncbi:MAG TPA: hypothetical protein PKC29_13520 [Thermodesulfobacteriota bacterium]|nr:hypothetical protein [Thermodesulfobacteriota bacterium]